MKEAYSFSAYASAFSPLLIIVTFFLKYFTVKIVQLQSIESKHIQVRIKWLRIMRAKEKYIKEDKCCNIILLLSIASFIADAANRIYFLAEYQGAIVNNSYNLLQFILLSAFYHYSHEEGAIFRRKRIAGIGIVIVLAVILVNSFINGNFYQYQASSWMLQCSLILIYSIYSFLHMRGGPLVDDREVGAIGEEMYNRILKIVSAPVWFNLGILLYFSGGLIVSIIEVYIEPLLYLDKVLAEQGCILWIVHNTLGVIKNIFLCVGMHIAGKHGMARRLKIEPAFYNRGILYN